MSTYDELLATVRSVRDRTGDPNAWQTGLTPNEVAAVITPATGSEQLVTILNKIRQRHPDVFGTGTGPTPDGEPPSGREQGEAAEAIADAEAALAQQNSASSQLDLQVISAILNAHLTTVEGRDALTTLQQETESAVRMRSDLDTPAGARDFQRFLIGKLRDIRAVVANANLDDTSKSALMAAWTSLYEASRASKNESGDPTGHRPPSAESVAAPGTSTVPRPTKVAQAGGDPLLDSLPIDDQGLPAGEPDPAARAAAPATQAAPMVPTLPSVPSLGMGPLPGSGLSPGSMAGWSPPGGSPVPGLQADDASLAKPDHHEGDQKDDHKIEEDHKDGEQHGEEEASHQAESPQPGPTSVTLPDGETVTAANPQLAAAIKAAAGGTPIADAFHQQGITIPAPGTAVTNPIDPVRVIPGDIGIFTDRHALGLGHGKALLDGQIQQIVTVSGPSFLGWEHPPAAATATAPAETEAPIPTRPAATSST